MLQKIENSATVIDGAEPGIALCLAAKSGSENRLRPPSRQGSVDPIELAIRNVAVQAIRRRANALRQKAEDGTSAAGEHFPGVLLRSPEAACALNLAADFDAIAAELEREARS
jgi:hypothetical protein